MSVIISKKNECEIHVDADSHILYELQDYFSFDVPGASFSPAYRKKYWNGKIYLFSITAQTLPAGLVYRLCRWLDKYDYEWEFQDNSFYGLPFELNKTIFYEGVEMFMKKISKIPPREYQIQAVYHALKEYRKTIISPTGSGKSLIIYGIARYLKSVGKRSIIIVPTTSLVEQLTKDMDDYGWNSDENIHKIYQGHTLYTDKPVTISTWQSVYAEDKKWFRQFDGVIFDECVSGDTMITMEDGSKKEIKNIIPGDMVKTFNEEKKQIEIKPVIKLHHNISSNEKMYKISLSNGNSIKITGNHKVLLENGNWKRCDELLPGDVINSIS